MSTGSGGAPADNGGASGGGIATGSVQVGGSSSSSADPLVHMLFQELQQERATRQEQTSLMREFVSKLRSMREERRLMLDGGLASNGGSCAGAQNTQQLSTNPSPTDTAKTDQNALYAFVRRKPEKFSGKVNELQAWIDEMGLYISRGREVGADDASILDSIPFEGIPLETKKKIANTHELVLSKAKDSDRDILNAVRIAAFIPWV